MDIKKIIKEKFNTGELAFKSAFGVYNAVRLKGVTKKQIKSVLDRLEAEGEIIRGLNGEYATPAQLGVFKARVKANAQGFAFLIPEGKAERENDYFVPHRKLNGALDKDIVLAAPVRGTEDEATILKILERGKKTVVGRFEKDRNAGYVLCDDPAFDSDVYIPLSLCGGAKPGDKVIAEITSYPKDKMVGGKIISVIGEDGDFFTEENAIILEHGLRTEFPEYVVTTAEKVAAERVLLNGRRDLRDFLTITIDGVDTRDIDDAVSLEVKDGKYILGVHIADVSHYVKYRGCIDKEAYERGTSVYFPDRVLPMLPQALSNGACSLNEGENRYAMTCFMTFDKSGKRQSYEICESVIRSDKRMTYDEVTSILKGEKSDRDYPAIAPMLREMETLTHLLESRRKERGEVELDIKEAHIYLNERGEIVIPEYDRTISHRLIEQFMVSANEAVAEFLEKQKAPCLYRVHESPAPEKAATLYSFVRDLGIKTYGDSDSATPDDYRRILKQVEGKPYASVVNTVMLRSMQKARYCEENLGHFGLASECYCHFTSPIRRYPDLFVHRVLKKILHGEKANARETFAPIAKAAGIDTSERERIADVAERDVDDLYKLAYMQSRIGEEYEAIISGVIESGIFAQLPNTIEGMVRLESLPDDNYSYYPEKFLLKGKRKSFKIGDTVKVKVASCDFGTRRIQFVLA